MDYIWKIMIASVLVIIAILGIVFAFIFLLDEYEDSKDD